MPISILNAGHGGSDPGAVANGLIERDINMAVAKIAKELMEFNGITVPPIISGADLNEVIRKVNEINAKQKVGIAHSVHHNAGGGDGSETIHSIHYGQATVFARILQEEFDKLGQNRHGSGFVTKLSSDGVHDYHGFIRSTDPSAVISEFAFLDTSDSQVIDSYEEQYAEGEAIAKAHCRFYGIAYKSPKQVVVAPPVPSTPTIDHDVNLVVWCPASEALKAIKGINALGYYVEQFPLKLRRD
jgi:N-acetylmuramoyl-L-alanine amidase